MAESVLASEGGSVINSGTENMSAIEGVISAEEVERQTVRLLALFKKKKKVCVLLDDRKWQLTAEKMLAWFQERSVEAEQVSYMKQGWIDDVKNGQFTNFIFLGLPTCDRKRKGPLRIIRPARSPTAADYSQMEFNYFTPNIISGGNLSMGVNSVVVVVREPINTKKDFKQRISGHYLESYIVLDGKKDPNVVSASALGIFAAPTPTPLDSDKAYWSSSPKLIVDFRPKIDVSLGLVIMTRDMAEGAPFDKIVLVSSVSQDHHYDFYSKVGRYTHIQSINGILLDGLHIEKVTEIFRKLPYHHIQLMIRYVHLNDAKASIEKDSSNGSPHPSPLKELPKRQSNISMVTGAEGAGTKTPKRRQTQNDAQVLPIPLFILGDNYSRCKELFNVLSTEVSSSPTITRPKKLGESHRTNGSLYLRSPGNRPPSLTHRSASVPGPTYSSTTPTSSPMEPLQEAGSPQSDGDVPGVRLRASSFKGISASDKYMRRAEMPMSKLEDLPITLNASEAVRPVNITPTTPGGFNPRDNLLLLHKQQYILHLPSQELDRQTTHLYFKSSGIYLVVVDLEDLVEFPLIQYENLFYWTNMIHTYVTPELKRMFVVGMYKRSTVTNKQLFEGIKVINNVLRNYRQAVRIPVEEQGYVYLYNREEEQEECKFLCSSIVNCSTLFCDSSFYFAEEVYKSVFDPFPGFLKIATDLSLNHERIVMETKYTMGQRFKGLYGNHQHLHLPKGYFETLTAFSPACISKHCETCLLTPSVIPDLLNACSHLSKYDTQIFDVDPALFNLPVVSVKMLRKCFQEIQPNSRDFEMIIWWMLDLSLIYSIGSLFDDEKFFVPYLLHHNMSDRTTYRWDDDHIENMFLDSTTLYAQFSSHVPLTVHLFHKVLAQFLTCILREGSHHEVFIHPDFPEAVLPLCDDNNSDEFICYVWIKYRAIQNIIELKAKVTNRIRFLKVVENKLSKSFLGTKYYNKAKDFNRVVTFKIPSSEGYTRDTVQPPDLLELASLEASEDCWAELLVATTHLTEPGNRKKTAVLRRWADRDPEAKELPADLALKITERLAVNDLWAHVGSRLKLLSAEDISLRIAKPTGNHGNFVLQKWIDSNRSIQDLIDVLKELHLDALANAVEKAMHGEGNDSASFTHTSKVLEKKLPSQFFLELSNALNTDDKWAMAGSLLKLLTFQEIESLRAKQVVDKGAHVLHLWTDSHLTYQDLINVLNNKSVRLDRYIPHVEELIKSHLSSS